MLPPLLFSLAVLGAWALTIALLDIKESTLPAPTKVLQEVYDNRSLLLDNAWVTMKEILVGVAIAFVLGLSVGVLIHSSKVIERAVYPWLIASQMVPIVAIAPLLVIWFGFNLAPKVIIIALVSFFPLVVNTVDGLRAADPEMINLMRTFGAGRRRIFRTVQLPAAAPFIFSGAKVAAAFCVIGAVFGEWSGASEGLGYLILVLNNQVATAEMFAVVLVLSLLGLLLFFFVAVLERLLLPWHHESRRGVGERITGGLGR